MQARTTREWKIARHNALVPYQNCMLHATRYTLSSCACSVWFCWSDRRGFWRRRDAVQAAPSTSPADRRPSLHVRLGGDVCHLRRLQSTGEVSLAGASGVQGAGEAWRNSQSAGRRSDSSPCVAGADARPRAAASHPVQTPSTLLRSTTVSFHDIGWPKQFV